MQERAFPDVNYRYYFQDKETDPCGVWDLLDFSNSTTWCLQETGREEAKKALLKNELSNWQKEDSKKETTLFDVIRSFWAR